MIIVMKQAASLKEISQVLQEIKTIGLKYFVSRGEQRSIIGLIGNGSSSELKERLRILSGVEKIVPISKPFKLASREFKSESSVVPVNGINIGEKKIILMAGPCAIESREQILETAFAVKEAGVNILRGGAFKPRTSPYSFQGMKEKGLELLKEVKEKTGLSVITEVMAPHQVPIVGEAADIFQIGTRNMQNYSLLEKVGKSNKPVMLKRGMVATIEEFLMAAEYILSNGNSNVILCERGIRTFEKFTRNTLDLASIPLLKQLSHLPVCVDPSHGTGMSSLIIPVSKASIAAGADCLLVEIHPNPEKALSDGLQSLDFKEFHRMVKELKPVAKSVNKSL